MAAEIERLCSQINFDAVCDLASSLNGGRSCTIDQSTTTVAGAPIGFANYHARILFDDGSRSWLLRVPRIGAAIPPAMVDYLILSEYATLKFLETTKVPAPRAFGYGISASSENHGVGVSFMLIEELPGTPWNVQSRAVTFGDKRAKVWDGLADILIELKNHPFPKAGSLCWQSSGIEVSAFPSDRFLVLDSSGPFSTSTAYYTAFVEQYLELIADGQLYIEYPINAFLIYRFLKDNVSQLAADDERQTTEKFYLKHVDDRGDHLLVDEDLNITGIIGWQMARVVPRCEAFGPSLVTADMGTLCSERPSTSPDDIMLSDKLRSKGLSDELADNMAWNEKVRRFFWGLTFVPKWEHAQPIANGILKAFGVNKSWPQWKEAALKEYESDERLQTLLKRSPQPEQLEQWELLR